MANAVVNESKQIFKRVLIGVLTGVSGAAAIYFLGFTKSKPQISELELKKNTIKVWRSYVALENNFQAKSDSIGAKRSKFTFIGDYLSADSLVKDYQINQKPVPAEVRRHFLLQYHRADSNYKAMLNEDVLWFVKFKKELEELKSTEGIDKELAFLIGTRIDYQTELSVYFTNFKKRMAELVLDTTLAFSPKFDELEENNTTYTNNNESTWQRIGQSIEDITASLSKKYQEKFPMTDFRFYPYYVMLKKKNATPKEVAPPDPNKAVPDLP